MKRLFGTLFITVLLCMVYGQAMRQGSLNPIKYCNVGPLAAVNLCMYCAQVVKQNAHNLKVLETHAGVTQCQQQLEAVLKSYNKTPQRLQVMKSKLCKAMGFAPKDVQLKLNKEKEQVCTNTIIKLISVDKEFLRKPAEQQWGVLAHELGHVKHNDCETQITFDIASSYVTALSTYLVTYALHIPHTIALHQPVAELAQAAYSRTLEKRADAEAAQVPGAAQGLLAYLETSAEKDTGTFNAFDTHPTYEERIAYLKPFVQQGK